jgi:hypothetical protein
MVDLEGLLGERWGSRELPRDPEGLQSSIIARIYVAASSCCWQYVDVFKGLYVPRGFRFWVMLCESDARSMNTKTQIQTTSVRNTHKKQHNTHKTTTRFLLVAFQIPNALHLLMPWWPASWQRQICYSRSVLQQICYNRSVITDLL